jgi:hypothetical protein
MAMTTGYQQQQPMTFPPLRSAPSPQHGGHWDTLYGPPKPASEVIRKPEAAPRPR